LDGLSTTPRIDEIEKAEGVVTRHMRIADSGTIVLHHSPPKAVAC